MKEHILTKPEVIDKLKKGSKWIAGFCCLAVLCNLAEGWITFSNAPRIGSVDSDSMTLFAVYRRCIASVISAVIMLFAAAMFFRIAKDGLPFTQRNARSVRIVGILFLVNALIPSVVMLSAKNRFADFSAPFSPTALMEGLLFLFIAHIIRYGAMLQQESDETL